MFISMEAKIRMIDSPNTRAWMLIPGLHCWALRGKHTRECSCRIPCVFKWLGGRPWI